jgi:hypothetical protein
MGAMGAKDAQKTTNTKLRASRGPSADGAQSHSFLLRSWCEQENRGSFDAFVSLVDMLRTWGKYKIFFLFVQH